MALGTKTARVAAKDHSQARCSNIAIDLKWLKTLYVESKLTCFSDARCWINVNASMHGDKPFGEEIIYAGEDFTTSPGPEMRLLVATQYAYLPQLTGGTQNTMHEICLNLRRYGVELAVFCVLRGGDVTWVRNRLKAKILRHGTAARDTIMGYPVYRGWCLEQSVPEIVDKFSPSVILINAGEPAALTTAFLEYSIPCVVYLHLLPSDAFSLEGLSNSKVRFVSNSKFTAKAYSDLYGIKSEVIPPLVTRELYEVNVRQRKVVFINPHPVKGAETAFKIAERMPKAEFLFVESWALPAEIRTKYRKRAREAGNIEWRQPVRDMREIYRQASVLLVPSVCQEAWGRVVTEAQFSGIPVLASRRGGLPESVGPGGILISPDEPIASWQQALAHLLTNSTFYEKLSEKAILHANRSEIAPETIMQNLLNILSEASR